MAQSYSEWYEEMLLTVQNVLKPYNANCNPTAKDIEKGYRRFYLLRAGDIGTNKDRGFIIHLKRSTSKKMRNPGKINIRLGLPPRKLNLPTGCPTIKQPKHESEKNQSDFNISFDKPNDWPVVSLLAVQVAEKRSQELGLK